jgi:hypothetical protein
VVYIGLETTWIPYFMATNVAGVTDVSSEALVAPLRLVTDDGGQPKLSKTGRPIFRVVPDIAELVRRSREIYEAGLREFAGQVMKEHTDEFKAEVEAAQAAGEPIHEKHSKLLTKPVQEAVAA